MPFETQKEVDKQPGKQPVAAPLSQKEQQARNRESSSYHDSRLDQFKKREGLTTIVETELEKLNQDLHDIEMASVAADSDDAKYIEERAREEELGPDVILKAKAVDTRNYELMKHANMMTENQ